MVRSGGRFLGETTNNVAEYRALLWGLATALDEGVTRLEVHSDSELIVRQIAGRYRVKNEMLLPLHREAMDLLAGFVSAEVIHVRREENRTADGLANRAMDLQGTFGDGVEIGLETQGTLFGEGEA